MLRITIPAKEWYDEKTETFLETKETTISLEHSLVSISKWESKWQIPFLSSSEKTFEQTLDYIKCMTTSQNVDPNVYLSLTKENFDSIASYINSPMSATTFRDDAQRGRNREIITSELIYYWMVAAQIPFECQKWHLNRLLTLIRICSIKNQPPKKMGKRGVMSQNAALNAARRKRLNSSG